MTTVAYKNRVLAADTRVMEGEMICPESARKIERLHDGSLFAYCGDIEEAHLIRHSLIKKLPLPKVEDKDNATAALHIRLDGTIWFTTGRAWIRTRGTRMVAIGTGAPTAIAAMKAGLPADAAVRIAMTLDPYSGGGVHRLRLQNRKPPVARSNGGRR